MLRSWYQQGLVNRESKVRRSGAKTWQEFVAWDAGLARAAFLHRPEAAVEQALLAVVAQADQLVAGHRQRILDVLLLPHPHVVGAAGVVAPDQHLVGAHHPVGIEFVARHHFTRIPD